MAKFSSFDKEKGRKILDLIRRGVHPRTAAKSQGVSRGTLANWVTSGNKDAEKREKQASVYKAIPELLSDNRDGYTEESDVAIQIRDSLMLFARDYSAAEAEAEADMIEHIHSVAKGGAVIEVKPDGTEKFSQPDAKPMQWLLERRFKENWSAKIDIDFKDDDEKEDVLDLGKLNKEELLKLRALREKMGDGELIEMPKDLNADPTK